MAGTKIDVLVDDQIIQDLQKKLLVSPNLAPYIVSKMAGLANARIAVPGILSGKLQGFRPRSGRTRRTGLRAIFKNAKTGFQASLWSPLFNIFTGGTSRGIKAVPLVQTLAGEFESSSIAHDVIKQALDDFESNRLQDLSRFGTVGIRRRKRR